MTYHHVYIVRAVLDTIRSEVSRTSPYVETGGPLAGYISDGTLVVTHAAGPGPRAKLRPTSVTIDGVHAQGFCDAVYHDSQGAFDFVGDWHRHLGWSLRPSEEDVKAMRLLASWPYCPVSHPVSVIYRSFRESLAVYTLNQCGFLKSTPAILIDHVSQ